jgi:radical SAM protein with 4Fe4S-binding SPASM domain
LKSCDSFRNCYGPGDDQDYYSGPKGHITVTGGEPFIRDDFLSLLDVFHRNRSEFSFAILTNGTLIDATLAARLGRLQPTFVQVSVEGSRETHDKIRGSGSFDRAIEALKLLKRRRIRTMISFTAHRSNYLEFPRVAELGRKLGVQRVWADRLIPCGSGSELSEQLLTPQETQRFFESMLVERKRMARRWFTRTEVAMHRALQFLVAGTSPYHCTAGDSLITVQPNADLYPCRRMSMRVGNLFDTPLMNLYHNSDLFQKLRDRKQTGEGCENCDFIESCRGGLKCLSFAVTGNPFSADPGCWLARVKA